MGTNSWGKSVMYNNNKQVLTNNNWFWNVTWCKFVIKYIFLWSSYIVYIVMYCSSKITILTAHLATYLPRKLCKNCGNLGEAANSKYDEPIIWNECDIRPPNAT